METNPQSVIEELDAEYHRAEQRYRDARENVCDANRAADVAAERRDRAWSELCEAREKAEEANRG